MSHHSGSRGSSLKLLIADDSIVIRDRIRGLLCEIDGVELAGEAGDVRGVVSGLLKARPDVLILDIRMPDGNGLDVLRQAKNGSSAPAVIILTNYSFPEYRERAKSLGADYFFDKSMEFEQVEGVLRRLVEEQRNEGPGGRPRGEPASQEPR